jgi:hypothetical protein
MGYAGTAGIVRTHAFFTFVSDHSVALAPTHIYNLRQSSPKPDGVFLGSLFRNNTSSHLLISQSATHETFNARSLHPHFPHIFINDSNSHFTKGIPLSLLQTIQNLHPPRFAGFEVPDGFPIREKLFWSYSCEELNFGASNLQCLMEDAKLVTLHLSTWRTPNLSLISHCPFGPQSDGPIIEGQQNTLSDETDSL